MWWSEFKWGREFIRCFGALARMKLFYAETKKWKALIKIYNL